MTPLVSQEKSIDELLLLCSSFILTHTPFCPFVLFANSCLPLSVCLAFYQQQIMRDRWMNVGYEEEELKPYIEPQPDYKDPRRTGRQEKKKDDSLNPFSSSHTATPKPVYILSFSSSSFLIFRSYIKLVSAHRSIYNMVLLYVQTSCCRWDFLRRRSRTRW